MTCSGSERPPLPAGEEQLEHLLGPVAIDQRGAQEAVEMAPNGKGRQPHAWPPPHRTHGEAAMEPASVSHHEQRHPPRPEVPRRQHDLGLVERVGLSGAVC